MTKHKQQALDLGGERDSVSIFAIIYYLKYPVLNK